MKTKQLEIQKAPQWFSMSNYDPMHHFKLEDWVAAFQIRTYLFNLIEDFEEIEKRASSALISRLTYNRQQFADQIKTHGSLAHEHLREEADIYELSNVRDLTVESIIVIGDALDSQKKDVITKYRAALSMESNRGLASLEIELDPILMRAAHNVIEPISYPLHDVAFAEVNLLAPDSTIIENFKDWLALTRENHEHSRVSRLRKFSEKDCSNWASSSVLPYFDLILISKLEGYMIPRRIIENEIFPINRDINVSEALKATTIPLFEKIIYDDLADQIESDLRGRQ